MKESSPSSSLPQTQKYPSKQLILNDLKIKNFDFLISAYERFTSVQSTRELFRTSIEVVYEFTKSNVFFPVLPQQGSLSVPFTKIQESTKVYPRLRPFLECKNIPEVLQINDWIQQNKNSRQHFDTTGEYLVIRVEKYDRLLCFLFFKNPKFEATHLEHYKEVVYNIFFHIRSRYQNIKLLEELKRKNRVLRKKNKETAIKNKQLSELDILKDNFLSSTTHELKTPLHGIISISDTLHRKLVHKVTEKELSRIAMINQSGKRLNQLVDDILDFSALKRKKIELVKQLCSLTELVDESLILLERKIKTKNIEVHFKRKTNFPLFYFDRNRIEQVILNILGNALKFTSEGKIVVNLTLYSPYTILSIQDTGIGIDRKEIGEIFEMFKQANKQVVNEVGGTGLGLSISKEIIDLHQGKILAFSKKNVGSLFQVYLPFQTKPS